MVTGFTSKAVSVDPVSVALPDTTEYVITALLVEVAVSDTGTPMLSVAGVASDTVCTAGRIVSTDD
jgi:hypothetical protein